MKTKSPTPLFVEFQRIHIEQNATQSWNKRRQEGRYQGQNCPCWRRQEKEEEKKGILCHLHIQSLETGSSRHWCFQQGHVNHEQLRQRHFRKNCRRSLKTCSLQQEIYHHISGDSDRCSSSIARRVGQARRQRRNQSCHQIHKQQVKSLL